MTRTVGAQKSSRSKNRDYRSYSFWLETAGEELVPRPSLEGPMEADVAVLGAGFTGLWTAYYLLRNEPSLRVVVLEGEVAGFGASGRNGAWCGPGFPVTPGELARLYGREAARELILEMHNAVAEVGKVAEAEAIDAQYHRGGLMRVARGSSQLPGLRAAHETYRALGLDDDYQMLDAEETSRRVRITGARAALYSPQGATVHPARLVRGLARAVEVNAKRADGTPLEGDEYERYFKGVVSRKLLEGGLICRFDDKDEPVIQFSPALVADSEVIGRIAEVTDAALTELERELGYRS